ncbi:HAD-like domain protein [Acididesulfobacillus acetoxydans]|uniref:5'-nucleotidase n=1 Tax=Acididesulfobacillus acetoxydans TaxID=1561005 RepID=A0A8S0XY23_9FIRM|nr:HAD hydrolase-like protein [Acididesulfobacillus acetoxydans]CAA7602037.1 HAD-like domain protein [Acididesulfobacillus acetoxydans]CEJ08120.1 5'-nucleotidase [Acididesulfobacillus acetoxydans]
MRFERVLWDLDGTLTDPKVGITRSVRYALTRLGYPAPEEDLLEWVIGPPLVVSFRLLLGTEDENLLRQAVELYRERFVTKGMFENTVYPGIPELLADLEAEGVQLQVVTSKPRVFAEKILEHFRLRSFFRRVIGSELDGSRTDKEELVGEALRGLPLSARAQTAMVGDRSFDVQGARRNGIAAIFVRYGYGQPEEAERSGPDYEVASVEELRSLLL